MQKPFVCRLTNNYDICAGKCAKCLYTLFDAIMKQTHAHYEWIHHMSSHYVTCKQYNLTLLAIFGWCVQNFNINFASFLLFGKCCVENIPIGKFILWLFSTIKIYFALQLKCPQLFITLPKYNVKCWRLTEVYYACIPPNFSEHS